MRVIIEARALQLYPVAKPGFHGGTETLVKELAEGLAGLGHEMHVVAPDLEAEERRGEVWWWGPRWFPREADVLIAVPNLSEIMPYSAPILTLVLNGTDPWLGPDGKMAEGVDGYGCLSETHIDLLCAIRPTVERSKCFITGVGTRLPGKVGPKVYGRLLFANDPARGLWTLLDIFDELKKRVPEATLHIGYDFERQYEVWRWGSDAVSQLMWETKARVDATPGVVSLGAIPDERMPVELSECYVHVMPSDPLNIGTQIHGITQIELAGYGCPLVLSDTEAFPEVFGEAAVILPLPGKFMGPDRPRYDAKDWAEVVEKMMRSTRLWKRASRASVQLAKKHTWAGVVKRWDEMLKTLSVDIKPKGYALAKSA